MRIFLSIMILIFIFQSWTKANDVRDFEIEGMSIGDSALDFFNMSEIKKNSKNYYKNKKYTPIEFNHYESFETYWGVDINVLTNDKKYKIEGLKGVIDYRNKSMEKCKKQLIEIADQISTLFVDFEKTNIKTRNHGADPTGNSKNTSIAFYSSQDDIITVFCSDYSEESGWMDHLGVDIKTKKFNNFLAIAYD